ncbi:MAG: ATP-binding protein [candidate division KSB1 bacterium]|nr:ATP-binding protein [candidate division KSB1 bacterium]
MDHRGYRSALIILTDEKDTPVTWAANGADTATESMNAALKNGQLPPCCNKARHSKDVVLFRDGENLAGECPSAMPGTNSDLLCSRLEHNEFIAGYLVAKVRHQLGVDSEEQSLFADMAGDIAYALGVMEMDADREKMKEEQKSLQNQILQAQKMEAVGRLAGGVAHDYNNMLSVIMGYAELAMDKAEDNESLRADLAEILNAAQHSADITRQLLTFARKQTTNPVVLDLNETVEHMLKMLRHLIGENIKLIWRPKAGLHPVKTDPIQINQVLANLCVNARDAIDGVGEIVIETDDITIERPHLINQTETVAGPFIQLSISDNGCGMDPETRDNIFEPFFTTKEAGQGTGLGLSTVYGIVKQNNGFIEVDSEPDQGTTFKIYLPCHRRADDDVSEQAEHRIPQGRGETVLIVEDEETIRQRALKCSNS